MITKRLTPSQARLNMRHYCAYQERCHQDVKDKLYDFGLNTNEVDELISELISEDFLNEERYARAFSRGKFKMKGWGKVKIRHELKQKKVSEYCIRKGLTEIDEEQYGKELEKLFHEKWDSLKGEKNVFVKKRKTMNFLLQRGYEHDLISELLKEK